MDNGIEKERISWEDVYSAAGMLADAVRSSALWRAGRIVDVYGVPSGGVPLALLLAERLKLPVAEVPGPFTVVVDDIVDSGATLRGLKFSKGTGVPALYTTMIKYRDAKLPFDCVSFRLVNREDPKWFIFPWDHTGEEGPESNVTRILQYLGEDPDRDGLRETPKRFIKAMSEMCEGYTEDPEEILSKRFEASSDEMVLLRNISFSSLCEHHLLPFSGKAHVAYLPKENGKVVGLSKLARLVNCYAHRLQIQERLTSEIATALDTYAETNGVGVVVQAQHGCAQCRGVRQPSAEMVTSCLLGKFRRASVRAEFLSLIKG